MKRGIKARLFWASNALGSASPNACAFSTFTANLKNIVSWPLYCSPAPKQDFTLLWNMYPLGYDSLKALRGPSSEKAGVRVGVQSLETATTRLRSVP